MGILAPAPGAEVIDHDIAHRHEDLRCTGHQRLAGGELIEIERVVVVDRSPGQRGEIADVRVRVAPGAGIRRELGRTATGYSWIQSTLFHHFASDADEVAAACTTFLGQTLLLFMQSACAATMDADALRRLDRSSISPPIFDAEALVVNSS